MEHAFATGAKAKPLPRCNRHRLTETQALHIFSLRSGNHDQRAVCSELAAHYKVTIETIKSIWSGKTWGFETGMVYRPYRPKTRKVAQHVEADPHHTNAIELYSWTDSHPSIPIDDELYNWTDFYHSTPIDDTHHSNPIDTELHSWAHTCFVDRELFSSDEIPNIDWH